MRRILGIDYGDVRVGLAVSDPLGITAQGLDTLVINNNDRIFLKGIREYVEKFDIDTLVIGYPKNMDGSKSKKTDKIDKLIEELEKMNLKIIKWDERLTTVSAYRAMLDMHISQKKKNTYADKLAATYILEGYLNSINK